MRLLRLFKRSTPGGPQRATASVTPADPADRLKAIDERLSRLERLAHGGKTVYLGNGRILTKITLRHWNIGYLLEADDLLLMPPLVLNGYHEIDVTEFFLNNLRQQDNCLDVGANFGYFTCIMGRWAPNGRTIALEPDPEVFMLLRDNIYINNLEGTTFARNVAAADISGSLTLYRRVTRSGNTSIAKPSDTALAHMGEPRSQPFEIGAIPLDSLLPEFGGRLDCIKIDVEGAELLVLRGAQTTIRQNPQMKIVMEWSPGQIRDAGFDPRDLTDYLAAMGLRPAVIGTGGIGQPLDWDALLSQPYHPGVLLTRAT